MANHVKKINRSWIKWVIIFTVLIGVVLGAYYGTYYFFTSKTDKSFVELMTKYQTDINKINSSATSQLKSVDLNNLTDKDITQLKTSFASCESSMNSLLNNVNAYNPPSKYSSQFNALRDGIQNNKKLYTQSLLILKNPKSNDIQKACDDLTLYVDATSKSYKAATYAKVEISLSQEIQSFPNKLSDYALKQYNQNKTKEALLQQYNTYFNSMDQLVQLFTTTKTNLNTNLSMIKNKQATYNDVYGIIDKKIDAINSIIKTYNSLNVPSKTTKQHQAFNDLIKVYLDYCSNFKNTLNQYETASQDTLSGLDATFNNLNSTYTSIMDNYNTYINLLNQDKMKYSDTSNL